MKNLNLYKNEIIACKDLFEKIAADPALLDRKLAELGKDPAEIRKQLAQGVDEFYSFYEGEVSVDTIQEKLEEATVNMTPLQQYCYYANLMTAFSHIGGKVFDDKAWAKCLKDHQNILSALELELIDEDDLHIADGVAEMKKIVAENIEAFGILFVADPDMAALQEACMTQDADTVKAMALNSRELAVDMAAAVYVMQESGELKSLGKTRYSARDIGVLSASILEVDAAKKSGVLETARKVIRTATAAAVALIASSPFMCAVGIGSAAIIYSIFEMEILAAVVGGTAMLVYGSPVVGATQEAVQAVLEKGAKMLDNTVASVKPMFAKLSSWILNTAIPAAIPIWVKCKVFTYKKIVIPAVAFIIKNRGPIIQATGKIIQKAKDLYAKVTNKATDIYNQGAEMVENIVNSARNLAEEAPVEDVPVENVPQEEVPVESEVPVEEETVEDEEESEDVDVFEDEEYEEF